MKKMKERKPRSANLKVKVSAMRAMTEDEERRFTAAIDALLAHWAERLVSRNVRGENHVRKDRHQGDALRGVAPQQQS
jgi:hypothetical protein